MKQTLLVVAFIASILIVDVISAVTQEEMIEKLKTYDEETKKFCNAQAKGNWAAQTDVGNKEKEQAQAEASLAYANYRKEQYHENFKNIDTASFSDENVLRKLKILSNVGTAALSDDKFNLLTSTRTNMSGIYNKATICPYNKQVCNLETEGWTLDPDIDLKMASSTDFDEMKYIWEQWHDASGKHMREQYKTYIEIYNEAAILTNFSDAGAMWRSRFEVDDLESIVDNLWKEVEPLYTELHKYVRYKLLDLYGDKMNKSDEMIPAHILGNMWAQSWVHLYDRIKPFKHASSLDVTSKMEELHLTPKQLFEMSDEFYMSLGLPTSNMSFNDPSIIVKPEDRVIACHASAWDFCDGKDFRIKMCTKVNQEDFVTVHHEMGHIMYYLLYKDHPLLYRTGANPGFHEAIGDTIALSVSTPKHLEIVGLLNNYQDSEADNINSLFKMALERVAFLPFGLLIDKWRWDLFKGATTESQWNQRWWELREQYQKVRAPSVRGEEYFDPGAKYHIPADSQYIAYFVAHILEFSFYKSLCIEAGQYNPANPDEHPLHKCDFYTSKPAGAKLKAGLEMGYSRHWSEALEVLTGSREISAQALLEYFKPLKDFLEKENKMIEVLADYEVKGTQMCNELVKAEWDVATDSESQTKKNDYEKVVLKNSVFTKEFYENHFKNVKPEDYSDEKIQRQLKQLVTLGRDALDENRLRNLTNTQTTMETIYNTARICPFNNTECNLETSGLTLDPDMGRILSTSENYDELLWTWSEWREKTGKLMRTDYRNYLNMLNEAAKLNGKEDFGEIWREAYDDDNLIANVNKMWADVEPLYNELHTYVRRKLKSVYGAKMNDDDGLIEAHLLGNMWAQSWVNLYEKIKPFKEGSSIDISEGFKKNNYTVRKMFDDSNDFFTNLGLPDNKMSYGDTAVIEKPLNKTITCHASAWDFCDGEDFRIKMCTSINQEDYITVHHEMGHINYFILYKDQPLTLRTGANPAFHEAVGDLIALSVSTPKHLEKMNLLENYADNEADNINALFKMALERVAFLPFGLIIDMWRWDLFSGKVNETQWNQHWWKLREQYQKVKAPTARGEEFFDPGAKYHIPADVQYIAYFLAHILEFQLHRSLCITAGEYDPQNSTKPLHKCDIDQSKEAGKLIRDGLSLGMSKHWSEALKAMTGETEITGKALVEYFKPLYEYLKKENENSSTIIRLNIFAFILAVALKYIL
ncbi:hypothetical protein ACKWTF_013731 [Chironomus riparius]